MNTEAKVCDKEGCWVSIVLRLAVASLFAVAAIGKFERGLDSIVGSFQTTFADTWLPLGLVTLHARATPFIEVLIPVWLITGFRLRWAWVFTSLFMVSLAFGMLVAGNQETAGQNYVYVLICAAGLYFSKYDRLRIDRHGSKSCA